MCIRDSRRAWRPRLPQRAGAGLRLLCRCGHSAWNAIEFAAMAALRRTCLGSRSRPGRGWVSDQELGRNDLRELVEPAGQFQGVAREIGAEVADLLGLCQ